MRMNCVRGRCFAAGRSRASQPGSSSTNITSDYRTFALQDDERGVRECSGLSPDVRWLIQLGADQEPEIPLRGRRSGMDLPATGLREDETRAPLRAWAVPVGA